jgi:hypothetical protein
MILTEECVESLKRSNLQERGAADRHGANWSITSDLTRVVAVVVAIRYPDSQTK